MDSKFPNQNNFVRWVVPGCWEDTDGVHHFEVNYLHRWLERRTGIPVLDTPREVDETIAMLTRELHRLRGPDAKFVIHRPPHEIVIADPQPKPTT